MKHKEWNKESEEKGKGKEREKEKATWSPIVLGITAVVVSRAPVPVQPFAPVIHLTNLLVAVFVILVVVWAQRIIEVIPVGGRWRGGSVLFPLLAAAALAILWRRPVECINVFIVTDPVFQRRLDDGFRNRGSSGSSSSISVDGGGGGGGGGRGGSKSRRSSSSSGGGGRAILRSAGDGAQADGLETHALLGRGRRGALQVGDGGLESERS